MKLCVRDYDRDKQIMKMREEGQTNEEIADKLDLTKARVGQLYRRIMRENGFNYKKPKNKVK